MKTYIKRLWHYIRHGIPVEVTNKVYANITTMSANELLKGRTALITGGTSGIGRSMAEAFLNAGANVIITSRKETSAKEVEQQLRAMFPNGNIWGFAMDNANVAEMPALFESIKKAVAPYDIDVLVNNAAINGGWLGRTSEDDFDAVLATNLKGTFFLSQMVAEFMVGHQIHGNILNVLSSSCLRPAQSAYEMSKWAVRGLTRGLAKKYISKGIVVNGISPGPTATPMLIHDRREDITKPNSPSGRYATPEEIANMAVVLTSNMGRMIVGDIVFMTGGAGIITMEV